MVGWTRRNRERRGQYEAWKAAGGVERELTPELKRQQAKTDIIAFLIFAGAFVLWGSFCILAGK
jgi:hypothetical protein